MFIKAHIFGYGKEVIRKFVHNGYEHRDVSVTINVNELKLS